MTKKHAKGVVVCSIVAGLILTASVVSSHSGSALLGSVIGTLPMGSQQIPILSRGEVLRRATNSGSSFVPAVTHDCALATEISSAFLSAVSDNANARGLAAQVQAKFMSTYCPHGSAALSSSSSLSASEHSVSIDNHCARFDMKSARFTACMGAQQSGILYEQGK